MVFSSLPFLFLFLPMVLLGHYILPGKVRNYFLLAVNLIFYAYGEPVYILLMLLSVAVNYGAALLIEKSGSRGRKKFLLICAVAVNLGALGWFKYAGLIADTLRHIPILNWLPEVSVALPIGISFYTFQAMSYVIDVYWGRCRAAERFVDFAAYISLFPQLIAGPIVRYSDVAAQLKKRCTTAEGFSWGVRMFVIGLAKKVLLANQFVLLWETVSTDPNAGTLAAWCGMAAYTLHIYFDFGGYSDMARGLGAMLGFDFCINFDYPYCSTSITEFWRRWHISLSSWFRDYVYIPLGGSRHGKWRTARNLMIVWMLTGLWHGAGWNFLFWGFYYGVLLLLEKFLLKRWLGKLPKWAGWAYTTLLVAIGWIFFASPDFGSAFSYIKMLFSFTRGTDPMRLLGWLPIGVVGAIAATPLGAKLWSRWEQRSVSSWVEAILVLLALVLCTASLVSGSYNPFLYFRF